MFRKIFSINLLMASVFLLTMVFPLDLFSYETAGYETEHDSQGDWIDESLERKDVGYKKVRCPQCGMEFYYIPGKESPHAHFVYYEVTDKQSKVQDLDSRDQSKKQKIVELEGNTSIRLLTEDIKEIKDNIANIEERERSSYFSKSQEFRNNRYEIRQKLTCPYDGYAFFPDGDVIEDRKLMQDSFASRKTSIIEASFSKSIAFGASKELNQFGYDLFTFAAKRKKDEKDSQVEEQSAKTLNAMGMLKDVIDSEAKSIFSNFSNKFDLDAVTIVPVGPDYIVGPGDTLVVNIWGIAQESLSLEVDGEGKIMLPKAGPLYVRGLKFREVEKNIKENLNQYHANIKVDVSMGKLRNIQVYVMGEVKEPGSYVLDPQSNIFQALYMAGGPTKLGSLRKIKLIHADLKKEEIDLYPFLLEGEDMGSSKIQSGDTVFVPTIGGVIAITGNVKRPAIYEIKNEISLNDILNFAGGIMPTGDLQRLQVERVSNNERRVMLDVKLKDEASLKDISMQSGDMVIVSPIARLKHDFVSILGNVERPGDYAFKKDMKVSDLIKTAKGFLPGTYLFRAEISRITRDRTRRIIPINLNDLNLGEKKSDFLLNEWDILLVYSEAEVNPSLFVEVDGAINRPGKYELTPGMKISDLVFKAGGVNPNEAISGAELFHIMPGEQPVVRNVSIKRLSDCHVSIDKDILLRAGDALFMKSESKLTERKVVSMEGEVKFPGEYSIRERERLSSLIERAGGFKEDVFLDGAIFTRKSIKEIQEKMKESFIQRENKTILGEQQSVLMRAGANIDAGQMVNFIQMRSKMIESIAESEMKGRMIINLMPISQLKGTKHDILLEDGDSLSIPKAPAAVAVIGSVNNPTAVSFENKKGIEYYIRKTGGLTKHADKKGIYVIKANGEALNKFMMSKEVKRGDTIVVPQIFKYWTPPGQLLRDTIEIFARLAIGVGVIAALD